ncbi:MAG: tetrathionate reductase family octaheme c-type cytochrome [Chloroflexi bacterium]|nr:tetrathionate reductase family octaheme c-type cytochrome [Chloroflexota bacterium]
MKEFKHIWLAGLLLILALIIVPVALFWPKDAGAQDDPWADMPAHPAHTDHSAIVKGPFATGQEVTRECLSCHPAAGEQMLNSVHFTWEGDPVLLPGRDAPVTIGKKNSLNNYCIGIQSNWRGCTSCHAGYGFSDNDFDFANAENIDCLACHDNSGAYVKGDYGLPVEGVDLLASAQSVGLPTRQNCGACHFNGGGGNAVKHGDLDETLYFPTAAIDVHMGEFDFQCIDCHRTTNHQIAGRSLSVSVDDANQVYCTDCHARAPHTDERINTHLDSVACETCHVPQGAVRDATKMDWDWSTAGQDRPEDPHIYLKIKGSFVYEANFTPTYLWWNGTGDRYILGDPIDPDGVTEINLPLGDINDPNARIWPFKVHTANQPYDPVFNYLVQPQTVGEYWVNFDWYAAFEKGMETVGLPWSGQVGFTRTEMYWPLAHMVQPKENALTCTSCHSQNGRIDWIALGYAGDPMEWGARITP